MELARHAFRKSVLMHKSNVRSIIRHSSDKNFNNAQAVCLSREVDYSRLSTANKDAKIDNATISNALGATDELTAFIGLAREFACDSSVEHPYVDKLKRVQMILFDLNHAISRFAAKKTSFFETKHTKDLEEWILEYANQLPPPEDYIIPGGGKACASLHVARTICKRAERNVIPLVTQGVLDEEAQIYLSRLSEFLLTVSRIAAKCDQRTENIYIPRAEIPEEKQ